VLVFDPNIDTSLGFPVFDTVLEANYVLSEKNDFSFKDLTEEDIKMIWDLSKQPNIVQRLIMSIAPSIFGHNDIKTALALAMFGGVSKRSGGLESRGDINVLVIGDPGTKITI